MHKKNMQNLGKSDLLAIIEKQQKEIESLKDNIKNLEDKLNKQEEEKISNVELKLNNALSEAEEYLNKIKEIHAEANKHLEEIKHTNKSDDLGSAENITNEEKPKSTEVIEIIDTKDKEESQITEIDKKNMMLIPIQTDLAVIEPIYIKRKRFLLIFIYIVASLIIAFSLINCFKVYKQDSTTNNLVQNLQNYISEDDSNKETNTENNTYLVNFDELNSINSDTAGWIKVDGISIDMPVVQADNNEYYLKYSFDKSYNLSGWAFVDYRNKLDGTDKNIIIYGHNRRDNIMFSPLINITTPEWYNNENNKYVTFIYEDGTEAVYEVCSIYQTEVEDYYIQTDFTTEEEHQKFLDTIKSRSLKDYKTNLDTKDQIITLSTCGNNSKYRVILHARKLKCEQNSK